MGRNPKNKERTFVKHLPILKLNLEGYHERLLQALIDYTSLGYRNWSYYEYLGLITLLIFFTIDLSIFFSTFDQQIAMISCAQDSFLEVLHSG